MGHYALRPLRGRADDVGVSMRELLMEQQVQVPKVL